MSPATPEGSVRVRGAREGWIGWWRGRGATMQAALPGLYAWAVTVAPVGWSRGASLPAVVATTLALASLGAGPIAERRWPEAARMGTGWGLVMSSIATWAFSPDTSAVAFDAPRGIAGMFGWGLFAFAVASPTTLPSVNASLRVVAHPGVARSVRGDLAIFFLGLALAAALQVPGWRVGQHERGLLLRVVALAGGLGVLTLASAIVAGRRPLDDAARQGRVRFRAAAWVALAIVLLVAGVGSAWRDGAR